MGLDRPDVIEPHFDRNDGADELLRVADLHHELGVGLAQDVRLLGVRTILFRDVVPDVAVVVDEQLGGSRLAVGSHVNPVGPVGGRPGVDVGSAAAGECDDGQQSDQDGKEQCAFHRNLLRLQLPLVSPSEVWADSYRISHCETDHYIPKMAFCQYRLNRFVAKKAKK